MIDNYPITSRSLRHVCTLQAFTQSSTDARGQPVGSWVDGDTIYARINPLGGRNAEYANQLYADATHEILIRYRSDITRSHRLVLGSRTFTIGSVQNVNELNRWLRLLCKEDV